MRALKYICISVVIFVALEASVVCVERWLHVKIPFEITLGLMLGVIAYFSNKLYRS